MLEFFTKLLTPVFITIGLVNPAPTITEQPQPVIQQEVVQQETVPEIKIDNTGQNIIDDSEPVIKIKKGESNTTKQHTKTITEQPLTVPNVESVSVVSIPIKQTETLSQQKKYTNIENSQIDLQIKKQLGEAVCGLAEEEVFEFNEHTENLCTNGTPSEITLSRGESYRWSCETEDDEDRCKAPRKIKGECGDIASSSNILKKGYDETILCKQGNLVNPTEEDGELEYFCNGTIEYALNARCSVYIEIDGVCGNSIRTCKQGKSENGRSSGDMERWQCIGFNGGKIRDCSAIKSHQNIPTPTENNSNNSQSSCSSRGNSGGMGLIIGCGANA